MSKLTEHVYLQHVAVAIAIVVAVIAVAVGVPWPRAALYGLIAAAGLAVVCVLFVFGLLVIQNMRGRRQQN